MQKNNMPEDYAKYNRSERMTFRLNIFEVKALKLMAREEGVTYSDMFRILIREGIEKRGPKAHGFVQKVETLSDD